MGCCCLNCGGKEPPVYRIDVRGREYVFEMHPYCGPSFVHRQRTWEILKRQPGSRHPFWYGFERWDKQGRRHDGERCVWDDKLLEPVPMLRHLGGRQYEVIGYDGVLTGGRTT